MPSGRTKTVTLGYRPKIVYMAVVDPSNVTVINLMFNDYRPNSTYQFSGSFGSTSDGQGRAATLTNNSATMNMAGVNFTFTVSSTGFTIAADSYVMDLAWGYIAST